MKHDQDMDGSVLVGKKTKMKGHEYHDALKKALTDLENKGDLMKDVAAISFVSGNVMIRPRMYLKGKSVLDKVSELLKEKGHSEKLSCWLGGGPAKAVLDGPVNAARKVLRSLLGDTFETAKSELSTFWPKYPHAMGWSLRYQQTTLVSGRNQDCHPNQEEYECEVSQDHR